LSAVVQNSLQQQGVDQATLQQVQEHRHLDVFPVGASEFAVLAVEDRVVGKFQFSTTCSPPWLSRRSSCEARKSQAKIVRTARPSSSISK
jgi:hypothetical protein